MVFTLAFANVSLAASPATPSSTVIDKLKQIEILKEKIATKVAEIRAKEKGGAVGIVKSKMESKLNINTKTSDITIDYLDDTIFYNVSDTGKVSTNSSKIKEGDRIVAFGYFDDKKTTLTAKYIYLTPLTIHLIGKIADMDKTNYTITVKEAQGNMLVDIETYTKTYSLTAGKLAKTGFSKLKAGDIVHINGIPNTKEENRLSATRIISPVFSQPATTSILSPTPNESEKESSPSANQ